MTKKKTNNVSEISPILMASIFVVFIVAMIFVAFFGMNLQSPVAKYFSPYNTMVNNNLKGLLADQKDMDDKIKELSKNGEYTFEKPIILKAPYKVNRSSALIIFTTEEDTAVKVALNDVHVTTVKKSKNHIIPIYQLYADASNHVTLTLDNGDKQTYNIIIEPFNNDIQNIKVSDMLENENTYYLVGDLNADISSLRGFDKNNTLMSYYEFGYFSGATLFKNKIALGYKQNRDVKNDIRLDIDYMGRISSITSNTEELKYEVNVFTESNSYIGDAYNVYQDEIDNYSFEDVTLPDSYTTKAVLPISEYEHLLTNSVKYDGEFKINYMGEYISYTSDVTGKLLIVDSKGKLYTYPIDKSGVIKTDIEGRKSLYISKDGVIYNLKTTLVD